MIDINIIKDILNELQKGKDNFDIYFQNVASKDYPHLKENIDFLSESNIVNGNIETDIAGFYFNNVESITEKGYSMLEKINKGIINKANDFFESQNIIINNNNQFNPTNINNNNLSSQIFSIVDIKTLSDLRSYIENNSNIDNKQEITNLIKELEEAKDYNNEKDYIDKFLKLLELLGNILPIPPVIIKSAKTAKEFFDKVFK